MKIFLHCYTGYTYFFREVLRFAGTKKMTVEWGIILYSNGENLLDEFSDMVGTENVLYLQEALNNAMKDPETNIDCLQNFPASIYACLATSKVVTGHIPLQKKPREYQLKIITNTYLLFKKFLSRNRPDFVFIPIVEFYDSMILYHLCKELHIPLIIYGHARTMGVSYFTDSIYETLPPYAFKKNVSLENLKKAHEFIHAFRTTFKKPFDVDYQPEPAEVIETPYLQPSNIFSKAFKAIIIPFKKYEPHIADRYTFLHKLRVHFLPITIRVRMLKSTFQKMYYDLHRLEDLPQKFIYYPLQYTPETSINIPAPFFIDQLRAIDLILNSMPPDYFLVVKEHPSMRGIRPISFYKLLKERGCVLLADFSVPGIEMVKRATLTISVTGTSCLEAFLMGKPSLHLGNSFFTDWLYKFDSFSDFRNVLQNAMNGKDVSIEKIVDLVSRVFEVGNDFILYCPYDPYLNSNAVMNRKNINTFLESLLDHIELLRK